MRKIINFLIVLSIFISTTSFAAKLTNYDERIKELEEKMESLEASQKNAGYDHGFYIKTSDNDFELKFRFFTQIYYEYDGDENGPDTNTFGIRRARLLMSGNVFTPKLSFMIMPEFTSSYGSTTTTTTTTYTVVDTGGNVSNFTTTDLDTDNDTRDFRLLYLWGQYGFTDYLNIRFGEFKTPMHRQYTTASNVQQFPNFPMTTITEPFVPGFQKLQHPSARPK